MEPWNEALVILAGVLVVIGFVAFATHTGHTGPAKEVAAQRPAELKAPPKQVLIPLSSPPPTAKAAERDLGALTVTSDAVPAVVDLSTEGRRDWAHWGDDGIERDPTGGSTILEGAPKGPRIRHALSPQRFRWSGSNPDGTDTGVRTCGRNNGFTLTAPAGTSTRVLKLYIGVISAKGRLDATLSTGSATGSSTVDQHADSLKSAVLTISFRAPRTAQLRLDWTTVEAYGTGCGGVALEAAAFR